MFIVSKVFPFLRILKYYNMKKSFMSPELSHNKLDIEYIRTHNLVIFESISGSRAYGTSHPQSDTDIRGVFVQPQNHIFMYGFIDQISDETNDVVFYELKRFFDLLLKNNPTVIEMLNTPEDCVIFRHPLFKEIQDNKEMFLSKLTKQTFFNYAKSQISKATGYKKKMNWEEDKIKRKSVLDFCYVVTSYGSVLLEDWLRNKQLDQKDVSLSAIPHTRDMYLMYKFTNGIVSGENANDVQVFSIPKELESIGHMFFNKDAYSIHCKNYREYTEWLSKRNVNRVAMNKQHGHNYDSKNMMHLYRLLLMAKELSNGVLKVRRDEEEIKELLKIKSGFYEYDEIMQKCKFLMLDIENLYVNSDLQEEPNTEDVLTFMLIIRLMLNEDLFV